MRKNKSIIALVLSSVLTAYILPANAIAVNVENAGNLSSAQTQLSSEELYNLFVENGEVPPIFEEDYGIGMCSVIDSDDRTRVEDTTVSPYKAIGKLYMGSSHSSCAAFATNAVITAAHCVYNQSTNQMKPFTKIEFGLNGDSSVKTITYEPEEIIVCPDYINGVDSASSDWAIILFSEKISNWAFGYSTGLTTSTELTTSGYPSSNSVENEDNSGLEQYTCSGYASVISTDYFRHNLDETSGQSGSPIYNSTKHIVGIISRGNSSYNTARRIKGDLFDTMAAIRAGIYESGTQQ